MALLRVNGRRGCLIAGLLLGGGGSLAGPSVQSRVPPRSAEFQIKAAFLLNFTAFVKWPPTAFADDSSPVVVAVYGVDPFGGYLDRMLAGETVDGRPVVVRRIRGGARIGSCHILFVSDSERARLPALLAEIRGRPILTISSLEGFNAAGGMIRLVPIQSRIRFSINQQAAEDAALVLSSRLLRLAENRADGS